MEIRDKFSLGLVKFHAMETNAAEEVWLQFS
jgi:hypothetical protein